MNLYWPEHPLRRALRSDARKEAKRLERWKLAEKDAAQLLLLSHGNCLDGVGSAIITLRKRTGVGVLFVQPNDMGKVLEWLAGHAARGRTLMIADLSLQRDQYDGIVRACGGLRANGWRIEWRDHHHKQWEGLELDRLREQLAVLEVNADATESGASLQQKALAPDDDDVRALAETIRDRDLWWNRTPDSETLEFALSRLGTEEFMACYLGAKPGDPVVLPAIAAAAQTERNEQVAIRDELLQQARYYGQEPRKVGIVYGWLPKNTGLHELLTEHGCALAANVRPNGKVSLRSAREAPVCHKVANRFQGGGHPNASGADLGLSGPRYWWYVVRRGRVPAVEALAQACVEELERA